MEVESSSSASVEEKPSSATFETPYAPQYALPLRAEESEIKVIDEEGERANMGVQVFANKNAEFKLT
jgi:hypothetical protein